MKTSDDRLFSLISCCEYEIESRRYVPYMYIYQMAGFEMGYSFRITSSGLKSRDCEGYLNEAMANGILSTSKKKLRLNLDSDSALMQYPLDFNEIELLEYIDSTINNLEYDDLLFLCITDIVMQDMISKVSYEGLADKRDEVEGILASLSTAFSKENFNNALSVISKIKNWR